MQVRRTIHSTGRQKIKVVEDIVFEKQAIESYKDTFEELRGLQILVADSFGDVEWKIKCDIQERFVQLKFDIEVFKDINLALKGYILTKITSGYSAFRCTTDLQRIKKIVLKTQGLKIPEKFESLLLKSTDMMRHEYASALYKFLSFYTSEKYNAFIDLCKTVPYIPGGNRQLPLFNHVLLFDKICHDLFGTGYSEENLPYMPIWLWWKITNIIPMRPTEMLKLKSDCIQVKEDGSYWITITRIKKKNDYTYRIEPIQHLQIDDGTYNLVTQYKLKLRELGIDSKYLFPAEIYVDYRKITTPKIRDRINNDQFTKLLDQFYDEIIEEKYGELTVGKRIRMGDTRHFAIINMFLQGFNMLSIARMAGHDTIDTQQNYYSHATHFAESVVYHLAQSVLEDRIADTLSGGFIGRLRKCVDRGRIYSFENLEHLRRVDYGFCQDQDPDFPINCSEDCRVCPYYIFKPSLDQYTAGIKWLEDHSQQLSQSMTDTMELMFRISKSINEIYLDRSNETLKSHAYNLVKLMDHKAKIDAKLMEAGWDDEGKEEID